MSDEITPLNSQNQSETEIAPRESSSTEKRILEVRAAISDLGFELDAQKVGLAMAMGAGVFLILLAALAGYDLLTGKAGIWMAIGITRDMLNLIAYGSGGIAVALITYAIVKRLRRDRKRERELDELEQEYSRLLDHQKSLSQKGSL
ncbi:MAG: hypothetical protein WBV94_22160 [Blastocatellia bacterium]